MTCSLFYVAGILLILAFMFITRDILPMGLGWAFVFIIVTLMILPLAGVFTYKFMKRRNAKEKAGS